MDTACPFDLANESTLDPDAPIGSPDEQVILDTANGEIEADTVAHIQIPKIDEDIEPFVLKSTPDVLTIGKRCLKFGYGFHWNPFDPQPFQFPGDPRRGSHSAGNVRLMLFT